MGWLLRLVDERVTDKQDPPFVYGVAHKRLKTPACCSSQSWYQHSELTIQTPSEDGSQEAYKILVGQQWKS